MKITSLETFRYDLPLTPPLFMMGRKIQVRSGWVICLKDENNHTGYGEIAPFPGLHQENLKNALKQLMNIKPHLLGKRILDQAPMPLQDATNDEDNALFSKQGPMPPSGATNDENNTLFSKQAPMPLQGATKDKNTVLFAEQLRALDGAFEHWLSDLHLFPSVRFGIESAVLNLIATAKDCPLYELLAANHHKNVLINGLLTGPKETIKEKARQLAKDGYTTIKLKVGHNLLETDIDTVKAVREAIPGHVALRLDANRSWGLSEAISIGKTIAKYNIDYIEEPLREPENLSEFFAKTGIPVALDESLTGIAPKNLNLQNGVKALVLKPCVLGGIERTVQFSKLAMKQGAVPVISSAFLSGIGLSILAQLAAVFAPAGIAMGLDTYKWLQKDILVEPFRARHGKVDVEEVYANSLRLRNDLLKPVNNTQ